MNKTSIQLTKATAKKLNLIKVEMDLRNQEEVLKLLIDNYLQISEKEK